MQCNAISKDDMHFLEAHPKCPQTTIIYVIIIHVMEGIIVLENGPGCMNPNCAVIVSGHVHVQMECRVEHMDLVNIVFFKVGVSLLIDPLLNCHKPS